MHWRRRWALLNAAWWALDDWMRTMSHYAHSAWHTHYSLRRLKVRDGD